MIRFHLAAVLVAFCPVLAATATPDPGQNDEGLGPLWSEPIDTAKPKYAEIIELTRDDKASNSIFRAACRELARRVFREECEDYGYICPPRGADIWEWPAEIDEYAIAKLKANISALRHCPDVYLLEVPLPVRRSIPRITCEMVENEAFGWAVVDLSLNDAGNVVHASLRESTSKFLEDSALESARLFKYQKIIGGSGYIEENNVRAIIYFDFDDVQDSGACEERLNGS